MSLRVDNSWISKRLWSCCTSILREPVISIIWNGSLDLVTIEQVLQINFWISLWTQKQVLCYKIIWTTHLLISTLKLSRELKLLWSTENQAKEFRLPLKLLMAEKLDWPTRTLKPWRRTTRPRNKEELLAPAAQVMRTIPHQMQTSLKRNWQNLRAKL